MARGVVIFPGAMKNDDALVHPRSRAAYACIVKQGWTDAIREVHGDARIYTFWHYMRNRWQHDAGLRLDHLLVSPGLILKDAGVDRAVRGEDGASDHAPAWIEFRPFSPPLRRSKQKSRNGSNEP